MKRKIFIGPYEIAGYYRNLTVGLRELGWDVTYLTIDAHPFGYGGEDEGLLSRLIKFSAGRRLRTSWKTPVRRLLWSGLNGLALTLLFLRVSLSHDVFLFGFGRSLLPWNLDLPCLRLLNKRIICNLAHGSELRPPYLDGCHARRTGGQQATGELKSRTDDVFRRVKRIEKYADVVVGAAYASHFLERPFVNTLALGVPFHCDRPPTARTVDGSEIRVVHAPSHLAFKGTAEIRRIIARLAARGYPIDYIELQDRTNSEVLDELSRCDVVIDQLYSDGPMAALSAEAAWFGRPAVVGGYDLPELASLVPAGHYPPTCTCHPDDVERTLEELLRSGERREAKGAEAQRFVREQWAARVVAERFTKLFTGQIPASWWVDPAAVSHLYGAGLPEEEVRQRVAAMVREFGPAALHLDHRPDLIAAYSAMIGSTELRAAEPRPAVGC